MCAKIHLEKNLDIFSQINSICPSSNPGYRGKLSEVLANFSDKIEGSFHKDFTLKVKNLKTRYIKIKAENYGVCPEWHLGAGGKTWVFVDEITIK